MTSSQSSRMDWHLAYEKSEKSPQIWHLAYESVAQNCQDTTIVDLESCGETFFKLLLIPKYGRGRLYWICKSKKAPKGG